MEQFVPTAAGPVPRISTSLSRRDHLGTLGARTGFSRNNYKVTPGLYCTAGANEQSPVLVTANYKLSFDALRKELHGLACWILVIDTRGINVWCAGGKGTFSVEEIAYQVQRAELDKIVQHRKIIIPQLAANGVALHRLKSLCGFRGEFGPVKASDIPRYLARGVEESMRAVEFPLRDRAVLIPYELCMFWKPLLVLIVLFFLLSGISENFFNFQHALQGTAHLVAATLIALVTGTILTPLALPWIPCRQFWLKGAIMGALGATVYLSTFAPEGSGLENTARFLFITGCSSYLGMNFTGSTVFTSLSGVEKEMRKGLAFQIVSTCTALFLWVVGSFTSFN